MVPPTVPPAKLRKLMGVKEYARHRGCSPAAVRKQLDAGRIKKRKDGKIDRAAADAAWPLQSRGADPDPPAERVPADPPAQREPLPRKGTKRSEPPPDPDDPDLGVMKDLTTARTAKESYLAHLRRIELRVKAGELVERLEYDRAHFLTARKTRDAMLAIADRLHEQLAAESDPRAVYDMLQAEIRQACHALADELDAIAGAA